MTTQGDDELRAELLSLVYEGAKYGYNNNSNGLGWKPTSEQLRLAQEQVDGILTLIQAQLFTQREQARQEGRNEVLDALEKYAESSEMFGIRLDAVEGFIAAQRKEDKKGD